MLKELWSPVKGYETLYAISNYGRVKSIARVVKRSTSPIKVRERILKCSLNKGYKFVVFSRWGKLRTKYIHRLVAEAFVPNPNGFKIINHKDENKVNNIYTNLEWCSSSYNNSYNGAAVRRAILKRKPISQYDKDGVFIRNWAHAREAAEELGISKRAIYECCKGRSRTSGGFIWKRIKN